VLHIVLHGGLAMLWSRRFRSKQIEQFVLNE
jgi:hypothetical protein